MARDGGGSTLGMATSGMGPGRGLEAGHLPGRHPIDAYGNGGFRFGDMSHRGSILMLPSGVRAWDVTEPRGIDRTALRPVQAEASPACGAAQPCRRKWLGPARASKWSSRTRRASASQDCPG